jgi:hypothetical protein
MIQTLVSCGRDPARPLPLRRGFLLIPLILVCFAFPLAAQAAPQALPSPTPDGCYPGFNTAEGCLALATVSGTGNTGVGWRALWLDNTGNYNTGLGAGALVLNTADSNTATGAVALLLNVSGTQNCAYGTDALVFNGQFGHPGADFNDGFGAFALFNNLDGYTNNAFGNHALFENQHGAGNTGVGDLALQDNDSNINTAVGAQALMANTDGDSNNAVGYSALENNLVGTQNNAMGVYALVNSTGAANTAVGDSAFMNGVTGSFNTVIGWDAGAASGVDGDDNIYIGATSGPSSAETGAIRIGDPGFITGCWIAGISGVSVTGDTVVVNSSGKLGVAKAGSPLSMKEILKERQVVQQLKATTEKQAARIALQEEQIKTLTASLREQATQIQKVSAQLEMVKPAPQMVENR